MSSITKCLQLLRADQDFALESADFQRITQDRDRIQEVLEFCTNKTICRRLGLFAHSVAPPEKRRCASCDICCHAHNLYKSDVTHIFFRLGRLYEEMEEHA